MADDQKPDEQIDPVIRVAMMIEAGETNKITSSMFREAAELMKKREQEEIERDGESPS